MKKVFIVLLNLILIVESSLASNNSNDEPLNFLLFILLLFGLPMAIVFAGLLINKSFKETKKRLTQTPEQKAASYLDKELKKMQDDYMKR